MRLFFFIGRLGTADFREVIRDLDLEVCGVLGAGSLPDQWSTDRTGWPAWVYNDIVEHRKVPPRTPYHDRYEDILDRVLGDSRSYYMIERTHGRGGMVSVFSNTVRLELAVWNALAILWEARPDRIVGTNTPHNVDWFLCIAAEALGIDVVFTQTSPLLWRTWVVHGIDCQTPISTSGSTAGDAGPSAKAMSFIERGRSSYARAIPEKERQRSDKYRGAYFRPWIELKSILTSGSLRAMGWNAYSAFRKHAALKKYNAYAQTYVEKKNYIAFFLHFQPERTTLPEGYRFAQQWLAIRLLSLALPDDWCLVVKEHPSTFRNVFTGLVRDSAFYDTIASLPNTQLAPLELTPFQLIDDSRGIATVTGKVGVEALIRGKPAIAMGAAQYRGARGVFPVSNMAEAESAVRQIAAGVPALSDDELNRYFATVESNSFPRDDRLNGSIAGLRTAVTSTLDAIDLSCWSRVDP